MSKWSIIKNYINSNEYFTRKHMINNIGKNNFSEFYMTVITNIGFVEKYNYGKYKRIINIPEDLTSTNLSKLFLNKNYHDIYMKKLIRKTKIERLKIHY